ncbi:hypothetical protein NQZ68_016940 [Dissostichus eleginoides]|nr:hypothetical protein NQZ68_016940 [Dissostichus eleginoides]
MAFSAEDLFWEISYFRFCCVAEKKLLDSVVSSEKQRRCCSAVAQTIFSFHFREIETLLLQCGPTSQWHVCRAAGSHVQVENNRLNGGHHAETSGKDPFPGPETGRVPGSDSPNTSDTESNEEVVSRARVSARESEQLSDAQQARQWLRRQRIQHRRERASLPD